MELCYTTALKNEDLLSAELSVCKGRKERSCGTIIEICELQLRNTSLQTSSGPHKKVDTSAETRYNTCGIRTSRRTGLPTTVHATKLAIETKTGKNYIVSAFTQNKTCQKGALLRSKGDKTATCPGRACGMHCKLTDMKVSKSAKKNGKLAAA